MSPRLLIALVAVGLAVLGSDPALAEDTVTLQPADGTEFEVDGRSYAGTLTIASSSSGLALTETTSVDDYLAGIKEVPFGWPKEALAAQVVAARTYLANTLRNGRSERGRRYGYDICASSACQVYVGTAFSYCFCFTSLRSSFFLSLIFFSNGDFDLPNRPVIVL